MSTKHKSPSNAWIPVGAPSAGTILALAIGLDNSGGGKGGPRPPEHCTLFIGTSIGLYRSIGFDGESPPKWERLANAPVGVICLATSPNYAADHLIVAGTHSGVLISHNGGDTWQPARLPIANSTILTLSFSPNYPSDGIILAGTLEDGALFSDDGGEKWSSRGFGLLDATVYSLAFSPQFSQDETLFAGTETALYYTYNNARAWKPVDFPENASPILSLLVSPGFTTDQTLYAGTESSGLYRSSDRGKSWQSLDLPAASISGLKINGQTLFAVTEIGIYASTDQGDTWVCLCAIPDVLCLATGQASSQSGAHPFYLAGLAGQGLWFATHPDDWKPVTNFSARSILGFALSPGFEQDGIALMYGASEGIWKSEDHGRSWSCINEAFPGSDVYALTFASGLVKNSGSSKNSNLVAASPEGVLISDDGGITWRQAAEKPASLIAISPNRQVITAYFPGEGIATTLDLGKTWQKLSGSAEMTFQADAIGKILAIAVTNLQHHYIALLEGIGETVSIWQGTAEHLENLLKIPAGSSPVVSFWIPPEPVADRPWYMSFGQSVWRFSSRSGGGVETRVIPASSSEQIITLTGAQTQTGLVLFASTGKTLYKSADGKPWEAVHDFGDDRALAIALSPSYGSNKAIYTVLLGGLFCQGTA